MGKQVDNVIVARGKWGTVVCAVCSNGSIPAEGFLRELKDNKKGSPDRAKMFALFKRMADVGTIRNKQQFKRVEGKIYEFKRHQVRVGCFQIGNSWVLTHGFIKKKDKWPRTEIDRAERIMKDHLSQQQR